MADTHPLDHVETWIFDLDNTLYPASCNLFRQIDQRMTDYVAARFALTPEAARDYQKTLYRDHGTTLRGLMAAHTIDPTEFLEFVHDIDLSPVPPSDALADALLQLPGRKLVYTNGSLRHATNVLRHMGIEHHFDAIYDIVAADYIPKPDPRPYAALVESHAIDPARAAMVEDVARNLVPAAALGMTTVWVRSESDWSRPELVGVGAGEHIHHEVDDLVAWLAALAAAGRKPVGRADRGG
jgi:putative hydrolase of the HAD superfamily